MKHRGIGFDRVIESDVAIPGTLRLPDGADAAPAVRVRWREPVDAPRPPAPLWSIVAGALRFAPPGVALFVCTADLIEVIPLAGAPRDMVEALLIATALPALLWLQGGLMQHAAAVVPRGAAGALAIGGRSGCGKSRLAAAMLARGGALLADDSIVVEVRPGALVCAGLAGGYHVGAADDAHRAFVSVPEARARRSATLHAIVLLDETIPSDEAKPPRSPLSTIDALRAILANRHRANVPRVCGLEPQGLVDAVRLARCVPVYRWPRDDADALLDEALCGAMLRGAEIA